MDAQERIARKLCEKWGDEFELSEKFWTLIAAEIMTDIGYPDLLAALKAVHEPYQHLTEEALEAGILMEFGPPKPEKGAALLLARTAIAKAEGRAALAKAGER